MIRITSNPEQKCLLSTSMSHWLSSFGCLTMCTIDFMTMQMYWNVGGSRCSYMYIVIHHMLIAFKSWLTCLIPHISSSLWSSWLFQIFTMPFLHDFNSFIILLSTFRRTTSMTGELRRNLHENCMLDFFNEHLRLYEQ